MCIRDSHLNALFAVCSKSFLDVIVQKGLYENETGAACELVDRILSLIHILVEKGMYGLLATMQSVLECREKDIRLSLIHISDCGCNQSDSWTWRRDSPKQTDFFVFAQNVTF